MLGSASANSCHHSEAIVVYLSWFLQLNYKPYILSLTPGHVGVIVSGTQWDQYSFTELQHNSFPDIFRHLSQQGWTAQSKFSPRIHLNDWMTNIWPFQVTIFIIAVIWPKFFLDESHSEALLMKVKVTVIWILVTLATLEVLTFLVAIKKKIPEYTQKL